MDELNGIPKNDFEKLSKYFGKKKAMEYIKKEKYNYQAVSTKLLLLNFKEFRKRKPIIFWICVSIIILFLAYHIFDIVYY